MKNLLMIMTTAITFTIPVLAQAQNIEPVKPQAQNIVIAVPMIGDILVRDSSPTLVDQLDAFRAQDYIQTANLDIAQLDAKKTTVSIQYHEPKTETRTKN